MGREEGLGDRKEGKEVETSEMEKLEKVEEE